MSNKTHKGAVEDTLFDMKHITAIDAAFIRKWQMEWLREHQFASPHEIKTATQKAIASGEIKIGKQ